MAPPKAVFFDLDDTLVDHQHSFRSGLRALQREYPRLEKVSFQTLEDTYIELLEKLHQQVLSGAWSLDEARFERFRQLFLRFGETPSPDEISAIVRLQREVYVSTQRPVAGAIPLLEHLRQRSISIVIVTNNLTHEQRSKLQLCGLEPLVDFMVTSEDVGIPKPHPPIFEAALTNAQCRVDEVIMIGDSWHSDVIGARDMGIRALWLNRYGAPCPDKSFATEIKSFEPIDHLLELLNL